MHQCERPAIQDLIHGLRESGEYGADALMQASEVQGMAPEMTRLLRSLEKASARLRKLAAEQALDMKILKEAAKGSWRSVGSVGRPRQPITKCGGPAALDEGMALK